MEVDKQWRLFFSSITASHTSEEKDESTRESGYSDYESSTSCLSEGASMSLGCAIPQRQTSAETQTKKVKEVPRKETLRKKSKEATSGIHKEPRMISRRKTKSTEKKGTVCMLSTSHAGNIKFCHNRKGQRQCFVLKFYDHITFCPEDHCFKHD